MPTIKVWAPVPRTVDLQLESERVSMNRSPDGWWSADFESPSQNANYGFILDGEGPFPDPRSSWQPNGVRGLSRLVEPEFNWTDRAWQPPPLSSAVIYELHVGTFTERGTFGAVIEKLDHLANLGVTHVELMPVNEFSGTHGWGYDGVDLFAPHHAYGGPQDLKRLVDSCHGCGLAVILDVVYNHLGPSGNYLSRFGPYFTSRYSTPWGSALNFDGADSGEVRRFFCDNALMWFRDYHFDGLRLDAVHAILDTSAVTFLEQLATEVEELQAQLGRHLVLIPESDLNDPRLLWSREHGGIGLDAQWSDDFHHALHSVLTGENTGYYMDFGSLANLAKSMRQAYVNDGCYSVYRRRKYGRSTAGLSGHRFLAYLQNHDQVGNRARGERSAQLMNRGRLKIGAALVFTSPFIPLLFQGEEWAASTPFLYFTDHEEPDLAAAVREGRRREFAAFGWKPEQIPDPQAPETFRQSRLNWSEPGEAPHLAILDWHRQLIRLRRTEPSLTDGRMDFVKTQLDEQARWLVIERGPISIACHLGPEPCMVPVGPAHYQVLAASEAHPGAGAHGIRLAPDSVAILKQIP